MAPADAASQEQDLADDPNIGASVSVGQLAHELNSLLDGSLRSVGLALRQIKDPPGGDSIISRLLTAQEAMWHMADLLQRAMGDGHGASMLLHRNEPIGREIRHVLDLIAPYALDHGVAVVVQMAPEVEDAPIGPLGTVVLNGLRNAVAACQRADGEGGRVELTLSISEAGEVVMEITDDGPGWPSQGEPPVGHGMGLDLCRKIVAELDGRLELVEGRYGSGALMRVTVPRQSLATDE